MEIENNDRNRLLIRMVLIALVFFFFSQPSMLFALSINVTGSDGQPVGNFKWLVEEDATWHTEPGVQAGNIQGTGLHASYMPVVAEGTQDNPNIRLDPAKHYFVSVLPESGYDIGGAPVQPGQQSVNVVVNNMPIPTAQFSVFVFEDNSPINNAPDLPQERGLEGFKIIVAEAGGQYGASGGTIMADAFGNMLGTTYNADGTVESMGDGSVYTDENGEAIVKNLPPGKYGVQVIPPAGEGWQQTSTIEGSKTVDAWVKANEPPYFQEFGPPGWHVFMGFIKSYKDADFFTGSGSISGQVVNMHMSRPPDYTMHAGHPLSNCWVGLNDLSAGQGRGVYAAPCDSEANFTISNVPAGSYELVFFDSFLMNIFAFHQVTVTEGQSLALGEVPVFRWFGELDNYVFNDLNENGFRDPGETGVPNQAVNIRWRDGTLYQTMPTDMMGTAPFEEMFPFFNWLVAEVDFARFKATGATITVDAGGQIDPADPWTFEGKLNPLLQSDPQNPGNLLPYRTESAPVLTQGFQVFLGQTNVIEWGKTGYAPGENGGISGMVHYATTRAENDPRYAVAENWEPGIPRVQVNLYADGDVDDYPCGNFPGAEDIDWNADGIFDAPDGAIEDVTGDGTATLSDVDNWPFGWKDGGVKGPEDVDRDDPLGADPGASFNPGDAIRLTTTDSWDDNPPTGCPGAFSLYGEQADCYDGLRCFNQVRPAVFDGGYAFNSFHPGGIASGSAPVDGLPNATYIVEAATPPGYQHVKEEDKNVDFGEDYTPSMQELPPACVGDLRRVPQNLSLFPGIACKFGGDLRPLPDRKQVWLRDSYNAAVNFFMFTEVPVAAHVTGFVLDDAANEFDPNAPTFGEKYAPPWLPVSFKDWTGREITRVYTDEFGNYNALLPSTFTTNVASPSGMSPNMLTCTINDRMKPDPANPGQYIEDPHHNPQYSQFSYTFQYMPGTTTYLDTPVLPTAAFAGPDEYPLDAEFADGTPVIKRADGPDGGPYLATAGQPLVIESMGATSVPNPAYDGPGGMNPKTIERDFGFGDTPGQVYIDGVAQDVVSWSSGQIEITADTPGQLEIVRANGQATVVGLTIHIGADGNVLRVGPSGAYTSIQAAIDAASDGDLILVAPGAYFELVILYKDVVLQGYGAGSTTIDAVKVPSEKMALWRAKAEQLLTSGQIALLPGQGTTFTGIEPAALHREEGAGITVFHTDAEFDYARIDGFTVTGGDNAGGIVVNGYATNLAVTNNRVSGNQGHFSGGIRLGHTDLMNGDQIVDAHNDNIRIMYNHIATNSGLAGPGGITIGTGADNYEVVRNYIVGNFSGRNGAGIGHVGFSDNGLIRDNEILFNQSFYQMTSVSGGGIALVGHAPAGNAALSAGTGSVRIEGNLIQGNHAGAGDGGGIALVRTNGADLAQGLEGANAVDIFDNMIVNNVSGLAGGGISLQDAIHVNIVNNTIANNDSTATAGLAFGNDPNVSLAQPAGIAARAHSSALSAAIAGSGLTGINPSFSDPVLVNDIIHNNRQFHYDTGLNGNTGGLVPDLNNGGVAVYADLGVIGAGPAAKLSPEYCLLTGTTGYAASNVTGSPAFAAAYTNGDRTHMIITEFTTALDIAGAQDEGGNFLDVRYGPLTLFNPVNGDRFGNYHLTDTSAARDAGTDVTASPTLTEDFDGEIRPSGTATDIGADELGAAQPMALSGRFAPKTIAGEPNSGSASSASCFVGTAAAGNFGIGWILAALGMLGAGLAGLRRPGVVLVLALALMIGFGASTSQAFVRYQCTPDTDGIDTDGDGIVDNDNVCRQIGAGDGFATMADGYEQYCFGFTDLDGVPLEDVLMQGMLAATLPSPTIHVKEGQKLYLNLTNVGMVMRPDLPDPHTIHWHGFPNAASIFDGVPDASVSVNMGSTFTYYYNVVHPGTFMYHCHVEATEHMQMGMLGNLYVDPKQNNLPDGTDLAGFTHHAGYKYAYNDGDGSTYYDVDYPVQLTGFDPEFHDANLAVQPLPFAALDDKYPMINGRGYPDTVFDGKLFTDMTAYGGGVKASQPLPSRIIATRGDRILLRLSSLSTMDYNTLGTLGLTMNVIGAGSRLLRGQDGKDLSYETSSVRIGGGEAKDIIIDTSAVSPGTYPLFAGNLFALSNNGEDFGGMMTEITVLPPLSISTNSLPSNQDPDNSATWPVVSFDGATTFTAGGGQGDNYAWEIRKPDGTIQTLQSSSGGQAIVPLSLTNSGSLTISGAQWQDLVDTYGAGAYEIRVTDPDNPRFDAGRFAVKAPVYIAPRTAPLELKSNAVPHMLTLMGAYPGGSRSYSWSFEDLQGNPIDRETAEATLGAMTTYSSSDPENGNVSSFDPLDSLTTQPEPFVIRASVDDPELAALGINSATTGAVTIYPVLGVRPVMGAPGNYDPAFPATWPMIEYSGATVFKAVGGLSGTYDWFVERADGTRQEFAATGDTLSISTTQWLNMVADAGAGKYTISVTDPKNAWFSPAGFAVKAPVYIEPRGNSITIGSNALPYALTATGAGPAENRTWNWSFTDIDGNPIDRATAESAIGSMTDYASTDGASAFDPLDTATTVPDPFRIRVTVDDHALASLGVDTATTGTFTLVPMVPLVIDIIDTDGNPVAEALVTAISDTTVTALSNADGRARIGGLANTGVTYEFVIRHPDYETAGLEATDLTQPVTVTLNPIVDKAIISGTVTPPGSSTTLKARANDGSWVKNGQGKPIVVVADQDTGDYSFEFDQNSNTGGPYTVFAYRPGFITDAVDGEGFTRAVADSAGNDIVLHPATQLSATTQVTGSDVRFLIDANPPFNGTAGEILAFAGTDADAPAVTSLAWTGNLWQYTTAVPAPGDAVSVHVKADTGQSRTADSGFFASRTFTYVRGLTDTSQFTINEPSKTGGTVTSSTGNCTVNLPADGLTGPVRASVLVEIHEYDADSVGATGMNGSPLIFDINLIDPATGLNVPNTEINRLNITLTFDPAQVPEGSIESGDIRIYQSADMAEMAAGQTTPLPIDQIVNVDYLAGTVTFRVNHLSSFGIGAEQDNGGGGGSCFIRAAATDPAHLPAGFAALLILAGAIALLITRQGKKD